MEGFAPFFSAHFIFYDIEKKVGNCENVENTKKSTFVLS